MRHGTDSIKTIALLHHSSIGIQRLDREPFLVEVVHIFFKAGQFANSRIARCLAILQRKLVGHVRNRFKSLAQTGAFDTACTDFEGVELIVLVENEIDLNRQFAEHVNRNYHAFADTGLTVRFVTLLHDLFDDGLAGRTKRDACKIILRLRLRTKRKHKNQKSNDDSKSRHGWLLYRLLYQCKR